MGLAPSCTSICHLFRTRPRGACHIFHGTSVQASRDDCRTQVTDCEGVMRYPTKSHVAIRRNAAKHQNSHLCFRTWRAWTKFGEQPQWCPRCSTPSNLPVHQPQRVSVRFQGDGIGPTPSGIPMRYLSEISRLTGSRRRTLSPAPAPFLLLVKLRDRKNCFILKCKSNRPISTR